MVDRYNPTKKVLDNLLERVEASFDEASGRQNREEVKQMPYRKWWPTTTDNYRGNEGGRRWPSTFFTVVPPPQIRIITGRVCVLPLALLVHRVAPPSLLLDCYHQSSSVSDGRLMQ